MANLGKLSIAITASTKGLEAASKRTKSILGSMGRAAVSLPGLLAVGGGAALAGGLIKTADSYTNMAAQLEFLTGNSQDAAFAQEDLFEMSQKTRTSMEDNATALIKMGNASEMMGTSTTENIDILKGLNVLFKQTGVDGAQASSTMLQLTQALGSGKLAGDEFRSIMENSPALMQKFAQSMGVGVGSLKEMASNGEITTEVMVGALQEIAVSAERNMDEMPKTISGAWIKVVNAFQDAWDEINDETGIMSYLFNAVETFSDWISNNKFVFVSWFTEMIESFRANWPEMKKGLLETWEAFKALFTSLKESGPTTDEFFVKFSESVSIGTNALTFFIDKVQWIKDNWDAIVNFVDVATFGAIGGAAAAAGTIAGGGSLGDALGAFGEASVVGQGGPIGQVRSGGGTTVVINTPVNKKDVDNIIVQQQRAGAQI